MFNVASPATTTAILATPTHAERGGNAHRPGTTKESTTSRAEETPWNLHHHSHTSFEKEGEERRCTKVASSGRYIVRRRRITNDSDDGQETPTPAESTAEGTRSSTAEREGEERGESIPKVTYWVNSQNEIVVVGAGSQKSANSAIATEKVGTTVPIGSPTTKDTFPTQMSDPIQVPRMRPPTENSRGHPQNVINICNY